MLRWTINQGKSVSCHIQNVRWKNHLPIITTIFIHRKLYKCDTYSPLLNNSTIWDQSSSFSSFTENSVPYLSYIYSNKSNNSPFHLPTNFWSTYCEYKIYKTSSNSRLLPINVSTFHVHKYILKYFIHFPTWLTSWPLSSPLHMTNQTFTEHRCYTLHIS